MSTAAAIDRNFTSPNVEDSNGEPANVVDVLNRVAGALRQLGNADAATPMGAIEAHGKAVLEASENIASAIRDLAAAIREGADEQ